MIGAAIKGVGKGFDKAQSIFSGVPFKDLGMPSKIGLTAPAAWFGLKDVGYDMAVKPMYQAMTADTADEQLQAARFANQQHRNAVTMRAEVDELQRRIAQSSMRLAALDPHLYNEVMAGRSLPKDAVVFGGQPRQDLMEELAMGMAQGQFTEPPSAQEELMKSLGV